MTEEQEEQEDRALRERKSLLKNAGYPFGPEQKWTHEHDYQRVPKNERTDRLRFVCSLYRCECGDEKMFLRRKDENI